MAWSLDVIFFLLLLLGCFIGAKVGLVRGVCKIAGWILSFVIPFICCVAFKDTLENWFGMVSAIGNGIGSMKVAGWLSIGISFVLLFFIVRLGTLLLAYIGGALVDGIKPLAVINSALGGVLGMLEAFLAMYFLLLVCGWLPAASLHAFIADSTVVGAIYRSDLMAYLPF